MKKRKYTVIDNNTDLVYYYTRLEWNLAYILVFLTGFLEGIIFSYFLNN